MRIRRFRSKSNSRLLREAYKRGYRAGKMRSLRESGGNLACLSSLEKFRRTFADELSDLDDPKVLGEDGIEELYNWLRRRCSSEDDVCDYLASATWYGGITDPIIELADDLPLDLDFDSAYYSEDDLDMERLFDKVFDYCRENNILVLNNVSGDRAIAFGDI